MGMPIVAVVDDDRIYQFTATKSLQLTQSVNEILPFLAAEEALDFLKANAENVSLLPDFIFLDINMPVMDGWMFLEGFEKIGPLLKKDVIIYMVSSSIDPSDINRANSNPLIKEYITKPISIDKLSSLLSVA